MKKFLLSTVGLIALGVAAPASAADMAFKAPPPPPPPVYSWNGFYIGGNGGWGEKHKFVGFISAGGDFADCCRKRAGGAGAGVAAFTAGITTCLCAARNNRGWGPSLKKKKPV